MASAGAVKAKRLLDGTHMPHNIATYAFGIGTLFGVGLVLAITATSTPAFWLGIHLSVLALFHLAEYIVTAMFNYPKLDLGCTKSYIAANIMSFSEFALVTLLWPSLQVSWPFQLRVIGMLLTGVGQVARSAAMVYAGTNFSHRIEYNKRVSHELVTDGIYAYTRHPSYFGYFWWGIGTQLMLGNPLSSVAYSVILWRFFKDRIEYEEQILVYFFGKAYEEYRVKTPVRIPLL